MRCARPVRIGARFCEACGAAQEKTCAACGAEAPLSARFCSSCGAPFTTGSETAAPVTPIPLASTDADRRQLTVMFCDLVGSTALAERLDPEELREVIAAYQHAAVEVIDRFEGHVAQYLGDGLLVYFGHPQAHEDDAQRAAHASLGIISALRSLNARRVDSAEMQLSVRIGIHTGIVVMGKVGGNKGHEQLALGDTPNLAARLQGLAAPATVVISERTRQLTGGSFEYEDLGERSLKGLANRSVPGVSRG